MQYFEAGRPCPYPVLVPTTLALFTLLIIATLFSDHTATPANRPRVRLRCTRILHTRIILQFIVLSLANIDRAVDHTVDKPSASSYVIA